MGENDGRAACDAPAVWASDGDARGVGAWTPPSSAHGAPCATNPTQPNPSPLTPPSISPENPFL